MDVNHIERGTLAVYFRCSEGSPPSPAHYGAKWAQIETWPCIFGVYDQDFVKFGHQITCRDMKNSNHSNDIDMTSNDLEIPFKSFFSSYMTFGRSY